MRLFRLARILSVSVRYGLDEMIFEHESSGRLVAMSRMFFFWRRFDTPPAVRLRLALESLGPIFVKFGQVLSTRRDLLPADIADELAKLQDRVPPFSSELALAEIERAYGRPASAVFAEFDSTPVASASIAQVHFARLHAADGGFDVAVKILRPSMRAVLAHDLGLLDTFAVLLEKVWADGKRLRPRAVVAEFAKYLYDELDLMREAANCSQLRRNFTGSKILQVPEVHWDFCTPTVMVMERMRGIPISQTDALIEAGIDLPALSRAGVEIFFTQVFRDGFFHADMHPGNIFVPATGTSSAHDIGIVGTTSPTSTRTTSRRTSSPSSAATTSVSRWRTSRPAGRRRIRASTSSRRRSAPSANRCSTGRSRKFPSAACCCACSRPRAASTSRSSRSWSCCRRRCSTSKASAASSTPNSTCGKRRSPSSNAG